jgi:predicted DNA-binding protein
MTKKPKDTESTTLRVRMSKASAARLEALARKRGTNMSAVVREALQPLGVTRPSKFEKGGW